jgi:hypothetical protein
LGKFDFNFDDNLIKQLEKLGNYDVIAPKILKDAVPILEKAVVKETDKYHEWSQDMELVNSIKPMQKPKKNDRGWYTTVRPTGTDSEGVRNMEKMAHLEFGYHSKYGKTISPKPILTKALNNARDLVHEKLQESFNEAVKLE